MFGEGTTYFALISYGSVMYRSCSAENTFVTYWSSYEFLELQDTHCRAQDAISLVSVSNIDVRLPSVAYGISSSIGSE